MEVTVVATDGQTSSSVEVTVAVPATEPSAAKIIHVTGIAHGLTITWTPPKSTGGSPITGYKLTVTCGSTHRTSHYGGTTHKATVTSLKAKVSCVARVDASNKVGAGPESAPATGKTLS
jgi:hypothetical protein